MLWPRRSHLESGQGHSPLPGRRVEVCTRGFLAWVPEVTPLPSPQEIHLELENLQKSLGKVSAQTEKVLAQPEQAGSAPLLHSELDITLQKMGQVYSLSSIFLEK